MGAARDAEQQPGPPGEEGPGDAEEQLISTVRRGPGRAGLGGGGAAADPLLCVPQSPWNIMIKHRQVQRRGRRSQMTTRYGGAGMGGRGTAGMQGKSGTAGQG